MALGLMKVLGLLLIESIVLYKYMGPNVTIGIIFMVVICSILVGPIVIWLDKAVSYKKLDQHTCARLSRIKDNLTREIKRAYGIDVSTFKIYVFEKEDLFVSKTYGLKSLGISSAMLQLDDMTLHAAMANELAHGIMLDVYFNRMIQINMVMGILLIMGTSYITIALFWIIFLLLCAFSRVGIGGYLITNLLGKVIKGLFKMAEQILMLVCGLLMKAINHWNVYQADKFVCGLGLGSQLIYYLDRFATEEHSRTPLGGYPISMLPDVQNRIHRIKREEVLQLQRG